MPGRASSFLIDNIYAKPAFRSVRRAQDRYSSLLLMSITLAFAVSQEFIFSKTAFRLLLIKLF
jgi:hypothetical protein